MRITEAAVGTILHIMEKKGLDYKNTFFEIGVFEGNLGICFTKESFGKIIEFDNLKVIISSEVDASKLLIDYGEANGKKGLIFLGEENED